MKRSSRPTLPNLLLIGAAKAGTTSLHDYLAHHPQIHMSKRKELAFFDTRLRWNRGLDWYKSHFDSAFAVNGESSPQYTIHPTSTGVPERIHEVLGTPKLIYIIRDPVERLLSEYTQIIDHWPGSLPFSIRRIESEPTVILQCSSYYFQLSQYLRIFPRSNIHVAILERLNRDPRTTLREIFRFLGVDEQFWTPAFDQRLNTGERKRLVSPWFDRTVPRFVKEQVRNPTWMPWKINRVLHRIARVGGVPIQKPEITLDEDLRLQSLLKADVAALREFLGDPLPEWRPYH